ncbi:TolC family protein [Mucilaginibacter sp. BJC16-A38]|uniref:TolC family protein n=1 Tax=Mucilaginibacter phenanthrenivorans TaxID=1234842 RepID=UPI0021578C85|nr:TolC family protein [Mucilaginibacter phenanthrenivorans]MCR8560053.1 TolC family protein [Mucilaginibacter phenanthrenivorans]
MKNRIFYYYAPVLMAIFVTPVVYGQGKLDAYIQEGLATNQSIKQQNFVLEKNIYALKEAKSMFLPEVTFSTTYTKADGGRTIDFPTGDLLNGAYATLNRLTGSNSFPQLQNQSILLNPDNFYDAKFHTKLPILNAELIYNKRIKKQQVDLQKAEVLLYKRELVKEIKTAYYNYQKAVYATGIYESSLRLVDEGQRINTKLYENSKVNRTVVLRSQNEVSRINASLISAQKTAESARYYFNFLLNRPLTDSVLLDDIKTLPAREQLLGNSITGREELSKLRIATDINGNLTGLARSYIVPKLGTFIDLGSQAFDWKFNGNSRYYLFGVSLEWNLFSSGKNNYRVKEAIADREALASQTDYVQQQLLTELKVRQASMQSAIAQYEAAQSQLKTSQTYYGDMLKLYKQGMAIYIELLDAQNQWIDAQLNANIALYDTWIADAAIERANASFTIQ